MQGTCDASDGLRHKADRPWLRHIKAGSGHQERGWFEDAPHFSEKRLCAVVGKPRQVVEANHARPSRARINKCEAHAINH